MSAGQLHVYICTECSQNETANVLRVDYEPDKKIYFSVWPKPPEMSPSSLEAMTAQIWQESEYRAVSLLDEELVWEIGDSQWDLIGERAKQLQMDVETMMSLNDSKSRLSRDAAVQSYGEGGKCTQQSVIRNIISPTGKSEATKHSNNYEKAEILRENKMNLATYRPHARFVDKHGMDTLGDTLN